VATLGCACGDEEAAGWSSPREQPVKVGEVESRTAVATTIGNDRPFGLLSSFISKTYTYGD
jgi:hypothetical protein